jgi:ABC-type transport system involved in multi-copper enzyme maturation permease subunit
MIASIANLGRWEWFKLRKRWMLWILLIFAILFGQLAVWGQFFSYQTLARTGGELTVPASLQQQQGRVPRTLACNDLLSGDPSRQPADLDAQVVAGMAAQCRQQAATLPDRLARSYQSFTVPGSFSAALGVVQTLALILIAILTASAIGIDYGSGTLRSVLTKGTGRWPYLTAKLLTLAILTAAGLAATLATVAVSSVVAGGLAGAAPASTVAERSWTDAGVAFGKAWVSVIPYLGLTTFVTVLARSSAAGMAIGLGYYFLEQILIALLSGLFSWFQNIADFLLVRNISAWTQTSGAGGGGFGSVGTLPDATHAIVVLAIYTLALGAGAFWLFERRDVQGATAG